MACFVHPSALRHGTVKYKPVGLALHLGRWNSPKLFEWDMTDEVWFVKPWRVKPNLPHNLSFVFFTYVIPWSDWHRQPNRRTKHCWIWTWVGPGFWQGQGGSSSHDHHYLHWAFTEAVAKRMVYKLAWTPFSNAPVRNLGRQKIPSKPCYSSRCYLLWCSLCWCDTIQFIFKLNQCIKYTFICTIIISHLLP